MSATLVAEPHVIRLIGCDSDPVPVDAYEVHLHRPMPKMHWEPEKVCLYTSGRQSARNSGGIPGYILSAKMASKRPLNVCVLDYLINNQQDEGMIPDDWAGKAVHFWGTQYEKNGNIYVPYLFLRKPEQGDSQWVKRYSPVDEGDNHNFLQHMPAAVLDFPWK